MSEKIICPKCDSDAANVVGIDKSLMPRLLDENYFVIGDFYQEIQVIQCGNCGCRFLHLKPLGFMKSISTETYANKPKSFKVKNIDYSSFAELSGEDKRNAIDNIIQNNLSPEDLKILQEEMEGKKKGRPRKKNGTTKQ